MSEVKFKGCVIRCVYDSESFKVYGIDVNQKEYPDIKKNQYGNVSVSGELPELTIGAEYEFIGEENTNKYGGYKILNVKREEPHTEEDMYAFLCEILTARQAKTLFNAYPDIVQRVKDNNLDDIDLSKLNGIKEYTFKKIVDKITENFCLADLVIEFKGYLNLNMIRKIYKKYTSIDVLKTKLKKDPYKCLCGIAGVGFKTADSLLLSMEKANVVSFDEPLISSVNRCRACILFLLEENENNGHTKMNLADLRKTVMTTVRECGDRFVEAVQNDYIYYDKKTMDVSLKITYMTEMYIALELVKALNNPANIWKCDTEKYRMVKGFPLSDEQLSVIDNICNHNVTILNGSAGSGKTFSTHAVINMLEDTNRSMASVSVYEEPDGTKAYRLMSPTGKASKVLAENTERNASTIHRGLGYTPDGWTYNKDNKLKCDIVIIDEFSMVDIWVFKRVIDAIDFTETKLLLIGDNAQLCSVGCGNLLHDFMQSKIIPTTTLTKIFRYGEGGLMTVATDARHCKPYLTSDMKNKVTQFGNNKDYTFIDLPSESIPAQAVALYKKLLSLGKTIEEIQVLSSKRVGDCGTIALNNLIQKVANKNYGSQCNMTYGKTDAVTYYEGDLVMQTVNNYKALRDIESMTLEEREFYDSIDQSPTAFVANGETGIIKQIFNSYMLIDFDGIIVKYTKADLGGINLGYAITIHKSQGSSIPNVILLTPQSHTFMLNSNLIYVGLTRMKENCFHLGALNTVNQAVLKKANLTRHTFMQDMLIVLDKAIKENETVVVDLEDEEQKSNNNDDDDFNINDYRNVNDYFDDDDDDDYDLPFY